MPRTSRRTIQISRRQKQKSSAPPERMLHVRYAGPHGYQPSKGDQAFAQRMAEACRETFARNDRIRQASWEAAWEEYLG